MKKGTNDNNERTSTKGNLAVVKDIAPAVGNMDSTIKGVSLEISLDQIKLNDKNKFGIRNIDELAESLQQYGQLHNIVVRKIDDSEFEYEMISGERRYEAAKKLGWTTLQAKVVEADEVDSEMLLIVANLDTRELNDMERSENAVRLVELIKEKRKQGDNFGGKKTREIIAEKMQIQPAQVQKLIKLQELIPEFKKLVEDSILSLETANQYAQMSEEVQKLVYASIQEGMSYTAKQAKELKDKLEKAVEQADTDSKALLDEMKQAFEKEKSELLSKSAVDTLKIESQAKEIETLKTESDVKVKALNDEITKTKADLDKYSAKAETMKKQIKAELEKELLKDKNEETEKRIKELQEQLDKAIKDSTDKEIEYKEQIQTLNENVEAVTKENNSLIDEYEKKLKEKKKKELSEKSIVLNMELLALTKQANNLLTTLVTKVGQAKSQEGFEMTDEVKTAISNIAKFGGDVANSK